jgi:hypothetical protein
MKHFAAMAFTSSEKSAKSRKKDLRDKKSEFYRKSINISDLGGWWNYCISLHGAYIQFQESSVQVTFVCYAFLNHSSYLVNTACR